MGAKLSVYILILTFCKNGLLANHYPFEIFLKKENPFECKFITLFLKKGYNIIWIYLSFFFLIENVFGLIDGNSCGLQTCDSEKETFYSDIYCLQYE